MSDIIPVTVSDTEIFGERGYLFNKLLGEGSYAKVWLVSYHNSVDTDSKDYSLACKIVDSKKAPRDFINKFLPREMDILTKINHPHLIHLHSIYQRKSKYFIFMRFAEKGDLLDHILANGEVRENQARLWTRQLSLGLQYLHELDIVHRDIKCENVLITANNNVKLADFGFSRFIVDASGKQFLSSTYCGSLAYAAPELLKAKPYDPKRSDVWSLGVVIYVMLNQCMPFNDADMKKLHDLQMGSKWTFRTRIAQSITDDVKTLVRKMLEPVAVERIVIEDVVNSSWFSTDERLRDMSPREREALDMGIHNKSELLPKQHKNNFPTWKKRKKDEQLVCVTSLRIERSSNQFTFETVRSQNEQVAGAGRSKGRRKSDEMQQGKSKEGSTDEGRKRADEVVHRSGTSGAAMNALVNSQVSRTDKFMSIDSLPSKVDSQARKIDSLPTKVDSQATKGHTSSKVDSKVITRPNKVDTQASKTDIKPTKVGSQSTKGGSQAKFPEVVGKETSGFMKAGPAQTRVELSQSPEEKIQEEPAHKPQTSNK